MPPACHPDRSFAELEAEGRHWMRSALSEAELDRLEEQFSATAGPGIRHQETDSGLDVLAPIHRLATRLLPGARHVRIVAFNKTEHMNWALPWHQDRVIAVRDRAEVEGYTNWTRKDGVWHVEPPIDLMQRMIFLRVHVDPATEENGAMQIAPGSHTKLVASSDAALFAATCPTETCTADRGDVLAAKALILHRSAPSTSHAPRRALRIDYSADTLPAPLQWNLAS